MLRLYRLNVWSRRIFFCSEFRRENTHEQILSECAVMREKSGD
jgi:hypothetical protein